ncbi:MAG: hypothetical protein Fur0020_02150 [Thermodesulfovibrionia bacterium]
MPPDYVVDLAGIIHDDIERQLNAYLKELEEKTTAQVVILTIKSLDGEDIEGFSLRTAERWRLGKKGKDNGILITIAVEDRRYRFEVGYGLEGILPDSLVGSIGRQYLVPYFRKGDYSSGILYATLAVIKEIASHEGVELKGMPGLKPEGTERDSSGTRVRRIGFFEVVFFIFITAVLICLFVRYPHLCLLFLLSSGGRRGGWYGGSGGGFGGGGFGGFGGGGGGGFGGGGASGRW